MMSPSEEIGVGYMKLEWPYVWQEVLPSGAVRTRFQRARHLAKHVIPHIPGTPEFAAAYWRLRADAEAALAAGTNDRSPTRSRPRVGSTARSWADLCEHYLAHQRRVGQVDPRTIRHQQLLLEATYSEPLRPGAVETFGQMPGRHMRRKQIRVLRDRKASTPGAANNRLKAIRAVLKWAVANDVPGVVNEALQVERLRVPGSGFHTWTEAEVARFEAAHPVGTMPRLALAVLLLLGPRRSDAIRFGDHMVAGDEITFRAGKTGAHVTVPVLPELRAILDATETAGPTWLSTSRGRPFTSGDSFGNWFKRQCVAADLPHCTAHGLRKAGSTRAAENGASAHELMAIYGWKTIDMAQTYTRAAERRSLARAGIEKILRRVPHARSKVIPHTNKIEQDQ